MAVMHANSSVVNASATTAETVIAVVNANSFTSNDAALTGVLVKAVLDVTASATGNSITYKIRQGNGTSGSVVFTATAIPFLTGVLTQSHSVAFVDTTAGSNPLSYTLTATASAGTMAINSCTIAATGVGAIQ